MIIPSQFFYGKISRIYKEIRSAVLFAERKSALDSLKKQKKPQKREIYWRGHITGLIALAAPMVFAEFRQKYHKIVPAPPGELPDVSANRSDGPR